MSTAKTAEAKETKVVPNPEPIIKTVGFRQVPGKRLFMAVSVTIQGDKVISVEELHDKPEPLGWAVREFKAVAAKLFKAMSR